MDPNLTFEMLICPAYPAISSSTPLLSCRQGLEEPPSPSRSRDGCMTEWQKEYQSTWEKTYFTYLSRGCVFTKPLNPEDSTQWTCINSFPYICVISMETPPHCFLQAKLQSQPPSCQPWEVSHSLLYLSPCACSEVQEGDSPGPFLFQYIFPIY